MPHTSSLSPDSLHPGHASDHFDHLCAAQTLRSIVAHHRRLCAALELRPARFPEFYPKLKANLQSWKAQGLLAKFDKRASHKCYNQGYACVDTKVLVIGAGPCGLRAAIEAQLLGAKVLVLEKRDRFSRNNVLHLWPMVIHDLKALGAKKFFGKFCAGAIDHISIRQLQCILLKVALLLGVEFHENVGFEELIEPGDDETGWRARLSPPDHPAADFQFDVLVGADGKRNTFKCFRRKEFRGKLAIAITANFVNRHTEAEARVDEISGVAFIFNQKFFKDLSAATGIDLENIVYYKDDTHYFVMTAKKHSLLAKGVILKDYMDTGQLLAPSNIDRAQLMEFAREAADFSTDFQLPELKFAVNHYGLEDLAMFDFTCMYASCYASTAIVRHGHGLLLQLVGDSLLEPFWPTGSGCARGFLSCFDAAWQMRSWANPRLTALECLAEREATYRLLAQTTPKNLSGDLSGYSLDPRTRYPNLNTQAVMPHQVRHMVDTDSPEALAAELVLAAAAAASAAPPGQAEMPAHKRPFQPIEPMVLLRWCRRCLGAMNIDVVDLETDFQSGEAICALVHLYRPELLQLSAVPELPVDRWRLALRLLQSELPVPAGVTADLLADGAVEAHQLLELLSRVYDALHAPPPPAAAPRHPWLTEMASEDGDSLQRASPVPRLAADGRAAAANGDTMRRHRKRKSEAQHQRASRMTPEVKKAPKQAEPELSKKEQFASKVKDLEAKFSGTYQPPDKKPKPVSRVIGRIEKDWSLQQIEKKIEENSRPFVNRDKEYPVPRWNRDAFDDKFQTIQSLSGGDVIPFRRFDYGQRGSSHVSAMAARFGNGHRPSGAGSATAQGAGGVAAYEPCHFCGQRVFLVDRMVAQQKFFHPKCFRCEYCSVALKPGNYEFDGDAGRFFCLPHFGLHSLVKNKYQRSETTSTVPPCPSPVIEQMRASHLSLRGATPERAEFENSVCDPMSEDELLSEMDEDEWTDRNFLTTEEVLSGADCSDSDSCSPDSDQFEPALDDDEVLQLAEQWRRLHDPPAQEAARAETEPDSDRHESDGAGRAGDVSDTGQPSETEEETSARLRRRAEDGLTERVLQSRRVRKRTDVRDSQSSGSERTSHRPAGDSSSAESDTEVKLRTPPQLPTSPTSPPPRIVIQVADRPSAPDPGQRPEPIGAERDSSGSGSGSVSGERPPSQERAVVSEKGAARGNAEGKSPRKEIGKKIVGSIPVLKKPVASLMGRNAGKPAVAKTVTTARVSISTLVQQKPGRPTSVSSEESPTKPTRNIRRNSAQRSRPPTSDSASWRNSTELKRQSLVGPPPSAPAAPAPARSRSAADLGSRIGAATGRVGSGQQTVRSAATESPRKSVVSRQASADATTRSPPSKIPTRPQPSPRTSVTNGTQRPVAARRNSPPERKTSAPAKLMTEKAEATPTEDKTEMGNAGNAEAGNKGKTETGKLGKSAPIRRGSGGNRVAAIAARDRVRRQVRENMLKQRMARKAREEANKSNGRHTGARRRSRGAEARVGTGRSDDAVDQAAGEEKRERRLSMEDEEDGERRRRQGSGGREDGDATSGSSGERNINSPPRARRKGGDNMSSSPDKSSNTDADSASEAISGCETSVEVRLPGPDRDVRMHSSSEDERSNSEQEVVDNDGSDEYASPANSDTDVRSTAKTRNFRDSRHSHASIPKIHDRDERRLHVEDETDDIHLSLSGAEEFDDVALEQRWKQMLGDDDELMEAGDLDDMLKPKPGSPPKVEALKPVRVTEIDKLWDDVESEHEEQSSSPPRHTAKEQVERSAEEGDTYVEFDALLNDVDVTNLERGFDGICDQTASTEDLSQQEDSSHGKITSSKVPHSDEKQSDDEESCADLTRRDTAKVSEHYSSHHSDTASDVSNGDSYTDRNEPLYDRPSAHRDLHSPESPEHAEDTAWVTADSATLDDRVLSESDDEEEAAWRTAETTALDRSVMSSREEHAIAPEDCALPEDEDSMYEEQEEEEPPRKPTSVLQDDDASSLDLEDRTHERSRAEEQDKENVSDNDTSKSSRRFNLDESFITFRRRRPETSHHRDTSRQSRSSSPGVIETREEVSPEKESPAASPPPTVDSPQSSPEPARQGRNVETGSDMGIEASMEYNQHWVDEWRDVDETTGTWMSQARREQERQRTREEDLSIEMEPAVDELVVTEARAVSSGEEEARQIPSEEVIDVCEEVLTAMSTNAAPENDAKGSTAVDVRHQKKPETREVIETKDEISADTDQYVVIVDEKFNRNSAIQKPMDMPKSTLNGSQATPLKSSSEQRSPSPDVLPHLKLFGGDETIDIVCERKRSAEKRGTPQRASLRERIKAIETAPAPAVSKPSEVNTSAELAPDSRVESRLAALRDAKKPAATAARGPAATSTPMGTARAPLTTLPTPISETEQTPDQSVPSAVFRLIHQTPDSEPLGPVWDWETPCRPRAPPSAPPPPIPETDSGPVSLEPAYVEPMPLVRASAPQSRGAVQPLPALSAPAAVLAATAAAAVAPAATSPAPVTSPVVASVAPPVTPRMSSSVTSPSSVKISAPCTTSTDSVPVSVASRISSTSATPTAVSVPVTAAAPKTDAVSPTSPLRPDFVSAATPRTRPPPVRVNSLVNKIWPPVSAAESSAAPVLNASSVATDGTASRAGRSAEPRSPIVPVSPTSPTTVPSRVPPTKPAKPILPALPLAPVADATKTPTRRASPKITTITFPWFETTTPVSPTSPTVPSTPPTPATPTISAPPTTPTTPSGPPFRTQRLRVSPLVEEASAKLLRRGATDPSLVIPPRSALSGAPMRLSRLPEDLPQETQEQQEMMQESQQERAPEESLIRDLVLSRVRRSPEKQFRKRVTSPALLGSSGPSVRPLPPPVPGEEVGGEADGETTEVIPPPPLTATRRLPPPPPPPPVETEAATETEEGKMDGQTDRVSGIVKAVIDFSPVAGLVDRAPSPAVPNKPEATPKTTNELTSQGKAEEPLPLPDKSDQPPPLPDKIRSPTRLSLIPAAARALFSPPRRPPRASDQRTPRRKKQGSAERKAVMSMPPEVVGALAAEERDRRPLSESLESPDVSRELESSTRVSSTGVETPSSQKKTTPTEVPSLATSPTARIASSAPALDTTSREATPPATSVVRPDRRLSPDTSLTEKELQPAQAPQATSPPRLADASPSKDKPSSVGGPAEPVTPARGQKESTSGAGERHTAVPVQGAGAGLTEPVTPTTRKKEPSDLKKKRERRRSIIQTISELFRHSTDKKEKDKDKEDKVDASPSPKRESTVPATPPSAADSPATPSPAAVAAGAVKATPLRNRLGLRFRKSKDKDKKLSISPSLSPPGTPAAADVTDGRPAADLSKRPSVGSEPRPTPSGRSSPEGTLSRRSRSGRAARHSEIRRQQRAQELQRQLGEVEVRQQELQICAAELERTIRGEPREDGVQQLTDDAALMRDWFGLVHERSLLVRRDQLLQLQLQQLQLEDRHDRLQLELRERMAAPEAQKSSEDIDRERELVNTLLELSEQRRALKLAMDAEQDALRAECESAEERQQLLAAPRVPLEESTV